MAMIYYYVMLGIALLLLLVYAFIFHKHFDVNITIMTVLVPVLDLAFVLMAASTTIEQALFPLRFTYAGGCFLLLSAMFLIFNICGVQLRPWMRLVLAAVSVGIFSTTLTIGYSDIFYKGIPEIAFANGAAYITNKHYGFMHTIFYIMVGVYYAMTIAAIIYSFFKKKQVPKSILILIILAITVAMVGFFGGRLITHDIEALPATYTLGMVIYLVIASRLRLYDPSDSVIDSLVQKGDTGFISFDNRLRYLGSNETAQTMIPELRDLRIDHPIDSAPWLGEYLLPYLKEFEADPSKSNRHFERGDKTYLISVNHLRIGKWNRGFQLFLTDDTANQQYIRLIKNYNEELEQEVIEKTRHIVSMQDKLVMGMATMIEGRDNSTGGHIKRTSDAIAILIDEIKRLGGIEQPDSFWERLVRAAPMHDLGKITIDDKILRKPGKFTDEEFAVMKTHAEEGARIIARILEGFEDAEFARIAINVAHYHHERVDGSGYPAHLKGDEIPLEARIMAVVDVYDALVSKRVYKERMSFEKADSIIMESMGKHFDKTLEPYYVAARPRLEAYYLAQDAEAE